MSSGDACGETRAHRRTIRRWHKTAAGCCAVQWALLQALGHGTCTEECHTADQSIPFENDTRTHPHPPAKGTWVRQRLGRKQVYDGCNCGAEWPGDGEAGAGSAVGRAGQRFFAGGDTSRNFDAGLALLLALGAPPNVKPRILVHVMVLADMPKASGAGRKAAEAPERFVDALRHWSRSFGITSAGEDRMQCPSTEEGQDVRLNHIKTLRTVWDGQGIAVGRWTTMVHLHTCGFQQGRTRCPA